MEIKIVQENMPAGLEAHVNDLIKEGWTPVYESYAQIIIQEEPYFSMVLKKEW